MIHLVLQYLCFVTCNCPSFPAEKKYFLDSCVDANQIQASKVYLDGNILDSKILWQKRKGCFVDLDGGLVSQMEPTEDCSEGLLGLSTNIEIVSPKKNGFSPLKNTSQNFFDFFLPYSKQLFSADAIIFPKKN